jgi:hypothetical protein
VIDFGTTSATRSAICLRGNERERTRPTMRVVWPAVLAAAVTLVSGCTNGPANRASVRPDVANASRAPSTGVPTQIAIHIPRPDYADPTSVAASFYTAWASVDSIHDGPGTELTRCANMITPALRSQLRAYEVPPAEWQTMRENHLVATVHVLGVTHPLGAPAPTRSRVYLSIYAERVTVTTFGRTESSAGTSVELIRVGKRWLVAQLLFY